MNILIKGGQILTMENEEIQFGDIGIIDDTISFIGSDSSFVADKVIDANDCIVMPGLINAHTHSAMTLLRNYADDLPFWDWLEGSILPIEEKLTGEDIYLGSRLAIAEMIRSGITTFGDMYMFMDEVAKAVSESGIRANLSRGVTGQGECGIEKITESVDFYNQWNGTNNDRIRVDFAPHAPYSCDDAYIGHIMDAIRKLDTRVHIHLSESQDEIQKSLEQHGVTPIAHMRDLGLFEFPTYAAHCVHITDDDINILKENGVSVVNNPGSNLKIANGFAPVKKMLNAGVNVSVATDGAASNNNLNMFEEMNLAALVNKAVENDATTVPAYMALSMGTIHGARALGRQGEIGSLLVGKKADIILVDMSKPHFYPRYNLIASLIYSAQAGDVKTVLCNGQVLMQDYKLLTMDEQEVLFAAQEAATRFKNR
ncbi:amidohydrolase [Clostridia bacterium]|nr:amidohydrolase [Clostridia bacterium]